MASPYNYHRHLHHAATTAPRVCLPCQQRKRKCDKTLPSCRSCIKIGRNCHYDEAALLNASSSPLTHKPLDATPVSARPLPPCDITNLLLPAYLFPHDPFRHPQSRKSITDITLTKEVSKIIGTVDDLRATALDYFRTIHPWLPIISKTRFYARLPNVWLEPQADFVLLAFCIFLIMQVPGEDAMESMQSSLYAMAKGLIALVESSGALSVEVVQARLLVALYELGHGIEPAAYISVGAAARCGVALGMGEKLRRQAPGNEKAWMEWEEEKRVWWGIIILDRFVILEGPGRSTAISDPSPRDYLPVDDDAWDNDVMSLSDPLPMSTSTSVRVGCFAREAQLSHLLGRVLRHVYDASPDLTFNREEALQLHITLDTMTTMLPMEAAGTCAVYGAALGMCYSARLLFEQSPYSSEAHDHERYTDKTLELIESSALRVLDIFNDELQRAAPGGPTPFGAHAFYQAVIIHSRLAKETGDGRHVQSVEFLKSALGRIDRRWKVAGAYLEALERKGTEYLD